MDDFNIQKVMEQRERGYIWLEKELKLSIFTSTTCITIFFLIMKVISPEFKFWAYMLIAALVLNLCGCYLRYRRHYKNYLSIAMYLDKFEEGEYYYSAGNCSIDTGVRSQIANQLERMGQALGMMKQNLVEEKEKTKGLVTDIGHQLKTPLAALKMSFELMEDESISEAERKEFLQRGSSQVTKMEYLLGALTNLSRMEADMIQIHPVDAPVKKTIINAVNGIYLKADEKNIEIEMEEFKDINLLHDPKWTAEAVANVLDNAVKYSPAGSTVRIRVEQEFSYILIEIEDEGIGIPRSEFTHIFQRFYRGNNPIVQESEGAGVGLYLVRQILEEQGGNIRALPARGQGMVFQMMLPKKKYSNIPEK